MSSIPSPDAKAVVRAAEALTTQVRRIADTLSTTAVRYEVAADDATTTPEGPRCVCGDPIELAGDPAVWRHSPGGTDGLDAHTPRPPDWLTAGTRDLSIPEQRTEAENDDDAVAPTCWHTEPSSPCDWDRCLQPERLAAGDQGTDPATTPPLGPELRAAFADEETLRLQRRESLLVLLTRLQRGRTLSEEEAGTLRHHVETEIKEANTARSVAAGNKRHVQVMYEELNALADEHKAADRIRAEVQRDRDQHAAVLREVLGTFTHETHPGRRCLQSGHINVETVEQWRSVVAPTVERPWWEQVRQHEQAAVDATQHVLELKAAIERARAECKAIAHEVYGQHDEDDDGKREAVGRVIAALDGTEQPTTEA